MKLMSHEETIVRRLEQVRDSSHPAPSTYLLAAGMNTVASRLHGVLEGLTAAGVVRQVCDGQLAGTEWGDRTWALTSDLRFTTEEP